MPLAEVDPLEFFEVEMVKKDGAPPSSSQFSIQFDKWTPHDLTLNITFVKPLEISNGAKSDKMKLKVSSPEYFVSAETGE